METLTSTAATAAATATMASSPMSPLKKKVTSLRRMVKGARKAMEQRPDKKATSSSTQPSSADKKNGKATTTNSLYKVRQKANSTDLQVFSEKLPSLVATTTPLNNNDQQQQQPKPCDKKDLKKNLQTDSSSGHVRSSLSRRQAALTRHSGHNKLRKSLPPMVTNMPHYGSGLRDDDDDDDDDDDSSHEAGKFRCSNNYSDDEVSLGSVESAISDRKDTTERQSSWGTLCTSGGSGTFPTLPSCNLHNSGTLNNSANSWGTLGTSGGPATFGGLPVVRSLVLHNSGTLHNSASSFGTMGAEVLPPKDDASTTNNMLVATTVSSIVALHNSGGSWGTLGASAGSNGFANVSSSLGISHVGSLNTSNNNSFSTLGASAGPGILSAHGAGHEESLHKTSAHSSACSSLSSWAALGSSAGLDKFLLIANPRASTSTQPRASNVSMSSWGTLAHSFGSIGSPNVSTLQL